MACLYPTEHGGAGAFRQGLPAPHPNARLAEHHSAHRFTMRSFCLHTATATQGTMEVQEPAAHMDDQYEEGEPEYDDAEG